METFESEIKRFSLLNENIKLKRSEWMESQILMQNKQIELLFRIIEHQKLVFKRLHALVEEFSTHLVNPDQLQVEVEEVQNFNSNSFSSKQTQSVASRFEKGRIAFLLKSIKEILQSTLHSENTYTELAAKKDTQSYLDLLNKSTEPLDYHTNLSNAEAAGDKNLIIGKNFASKTLLCNNAQEQKLFHGTLNDLGIHASRQLPKQQFMDKFNTSFVLKLEKALHSTFDALITWSYSFDFAMARNNELSDPSAESICNLLENLKRSFELLFAVGISSSSDERNYQNSSMLKIATVQELSSQPFKPEYAFGSHRCGRVPTKLQNHWKDLKLLLSNFNDSTHAERAANLYNKGIETINEMQQLAVLWSLKLQILQSENWHRKTELESYKLKAMKRLGLFEAAFNKMTFVVHDQLLSPLELLINIVTNTKHAVSHDGSSVSTWEKRIRSVPQAATPVHSLKSISTFGNLPNDDSQSHYGAATNSSKQKPSQMRPFSNSFAPPAIQKASLKTDTTETLNSTYSQQKKESDLISIAPRAVVVALEEVLPQLLNAIQLVPRCIAELRLKTLEKNTSEPPNLTGYLESEYENLQLQSKLNSSNCY